MLKPWQIRIEGERRRDFVSFEEVAPTKAKWFYTDRHGCWSKDEGAQGWWGELLPPAITIVSVDHDSGDEDDARGART